MEEKQQDDNLVKRSTKLNVTFFSRIKRIGLIFPLIPIYVILIPTTLIFVFLLGILQNIVLLITRNRLDFISNLNITILTFDFNFTKCLFFLSHENPFRSTEKEDFLQDITIKRYHVFIRFIALPIYLFTICYYTIFYFFYWFISLFNYLINRHFHKFSDKVSTSLLDTLLKLLYLAGEIEKPVKSKWFDHWFPLFLYVIGIDYYLRFYGFYLIVTDSYPLKTVLELATIIVFVIIYVFLLPKYMLQPSIEEDDDSKDIRKSFGLSTFKTPLKDISISVVSTVMMLGIIYGLIAVNLHDRYTGKMFSIVKENVYYYLIGGGFMPGITEEIVFRGVLIVLFQKRFSISKSIIFSSLIFGLAHFVYSIPTYTLEYFEDIILRARQAIFTTFFGIFIGLFFIVSKSLYGPIIMHSLWDIVVNLIWFNELDSDWSFLEFIIYMFAPIIATLIVMIIGIFTLRKLYNRPELLRGRRWKKKQLIEITPANDE